MKLFKEVRKDVKENGVVVTHYEPQADVTIMSMNIENGKFEEKKITDFSKHENIKMYKFHDAIERFKDFWLSDNHSAIVRDKQTSLYGKVTPMDIILDPNRYELVQMIGSPLARRFIPCNDIEVTLDESKTIGYDFTVEDNYTFTTDDGVVVQDSMAAYFTMTQEAQDSLIKHCHIDNNLFTNFNNELTLSLGHDIVYGIFLLSKRKPSALPEPLYNYMIEKKWDCINKKRLAEFLNYYIRLDKKKHADIVNKLVTLGFTISSRYSQTLLSFDNIKKSIIPLDKRKALFDKYMSKEITMYQYVQEEDKMIDDLKKICLFTDLIESGSRGSWQQAKQMFCQRGFVTNSAGHIKPIPVWKNLTEGLDSKSMFLSCYGVRKGLADVADNTAVSGAFTRGLIYLGLEARQSSSKKPCNTTNYLRFKPDNEKMASALIGRYIFNDDLCTSMTRITYDNYKDFIGQELRLRSPIFCTEKEYCHYCCPHKELSELEPGKTYNVGVVAAGALSEPLTQLTLRSFHTSGSLTKISEGEEDDQDKDITYDIRGIQKMFSKPDFDIYTVGDWVKKLYLSFLDKKNIKVMLFEVLASCLMWVKPEDEDEPNIHWRLAQDRELMLIGYSKVPEYESFLLGAAFKNFKRKLLSSIGKSVGDSRFDRMIIGN